MPKKHSNPIGVGLASYGMSGSVFHAPLLTANRQLRLECIHERSKSLSSKRFPQARVVRSFQELLQAQEVELVVVNTPDSLHYPMAREALLAGKHVVVEKPFVLTPAHGQELIDLAESRNLTLSVFQNRRWDGDFLTVRRIVEQGLLGRLVEFKSNFDRYRNFIQEDTWKEDGSSGTSLVYNLGTHLIDQALVLFGNPTAVWADIGAIRENSTIDDYFLIGLKYPQVRVWIRSSYLVREPEPRFTLHGTEGSFLKWGLDPQEQALKSGVLPQGKSWGCEPEKEWGMLNTTLNGKHFRGAYATAPGAYQQYYNNIFAAIREGKALEVTAHQALMGIRVIEAAYRSAREGRVTEL